MAPAHLPIAIERMGDTEFEPLALKFQTGSRACWSVREALE